MKLFSWMQSKLNNGKQTTTKQHSGSATHHMKHEACKEEFSDWPNGLLAIGTFGNDNLKDPAKSNLKSSCQNQPEGIIPDGVKEFYKELTMLLQSNSDSAEGSGECSLPLEEFSACLQSLQDENCDTSADKESRLQRSTSLVRRRGNDIGSDKTNSDIPKKSLSFLLKKTFACAGGFNPTPLLKDPFPEPKLERSIMEKIMRTILHKKIYPQSSTPRPTGMKYLNNQDMFETDSEDDSSEKSSAGSKWVKTDSEYIVLEI